MCKYIQGNMCLLGHQCHCHPVRHQPGYNDGYFEQDDTRIYDKESDESRCKLSCLDSIV